jgi:UDP-N-acetylglucosamine transferase subunit ALG13
VILALAGTNPYPFDRLIVPLDAMAGEHGWDVFIQTGHTQYAPLHCRYESFIERGCLLHLIEQAELVITQGGYGSIRDALLYNKPVVAVPRYPELGESTDRQDELVRAMEDMMYLIGVYDIALLEDAISAARDFTPAPRRSSNIPAMLGDYVTLLTGARDGG